MSHPYPQTQYVLFLVLWGLFGCNSATKDDHGDFWKNHPIASGELLCVMFVVPDCPLAMNYTREFNLLAQKWSDSGVSFLVVIPGDLYSDKEIERFQRTYEFNHRLVVDKDLSYTMALGATVSPEFFVFNASHECLYYGKMDEWVRDLGSKYGGHGRNFVQEAISAGLLGQYPEIRHKEAIGCSLEIE